MHPFEGPHLTDRQMEVLQLIADGKTASEIAEILGISPHTVNTHKERMFEKAEVYKDTSLVAWAFRAHVLA